MGDRYGKSVHYLVDSRVWRPVHDQVSFHTKAQVRDRVNARVWQQVCSLVREALYD